ATRTVKKPLDLSTSADGLPLREVGYWSLNKLRYLAAYAYIFATSMRQKWFTVYIDLFAGPGKSLVKDTGEVVKGSPLVALELVYPFNRYIFVEAEPKALNALEKRVAPYKEKVEIHTKGIDCNAAPRKITSLVPPNSLTLAFIDPEGCDVHFSTIQAMAETGRVDLFMTFPMGMDVKRNVDKAARSPGPELTKYDHFFGSTNWRQTYLTALSSRGWKFAIRKTMEFYKDQLKQLGYVQVDASDEILIKTTKTNVPLYYLVFASKHPRGKDFWKKISSRTPSGQTSFKFNE
ncbi:MAG: three-Cys-motif partner protein TcmP, partial [Candidatus Binatia bacterium]